MLHNTICALSAAARACLLWQERTYTFVSLTLHSLQRVYRDWNERLRAFLLARNPPRFPFAAERATTFRKVR
jgi:hypothetical protein